MRSSSLLVRMFGSCRLRLAAVTLLFAGAACGEEAPFAKRPALVLVFVVDGLRPDLVGPETTPTLERLRREGVEYVNGHSAFPTVTRVNAAVLVTGTHPQQTGITANTLFDRRLNGGQPFNTGQAENLWPLAEVRGGRILRPVTLGEAVTAAGFSFAVVSSGSTGQALLLNPEVRRGSGVVVNGGFEGNRRTAYPDKEDAVIRARFGLKPADPQADSLEWTERVLRERVLAEIKPAVVIDWLTEPDHTQHQAGVGSPATLAAIARSDAAIARTLELLERSGRLASTAVIVTADHGFVANEATVNVTEALIRENLKQSAVSRDVVITSDGQSVQFFVEHRDPAKIRAIVELLQKQPWADALFVDATAPGAAAASSGEKPRSPPEDGWLPGTFSLQLIHLASAENRPDIVLTLPWRSEKNAFGYPGRQTVHGTKAGPITTHASGHGGMSPWALRTPLLLWGAAFKSRTTISAPAGNVDIMPTVLALLGVDAPAGTDGRVLAEALAGGPDPQKVVVQVLSHEVRGTGDFRAAIQLSAVGGTRYIDKAWRIRAER